MWVPYVMMGIVILIILVLYTILILGGVLIGYGIIGLLKGFPIIGSVKIILGVSIIYFSDKFRKKFENFEI